jgi:hypothetical protein
MLYIDSCITQQFSQFLFYTRTLLMIKQSESIEYEFFLFFPFATETTSNLLLLYCYCPASVMMCIGYFLPVYNGFPFPRVYIPITDCNSYWSRKNAITCRVEKMHDFLPLLFFIVFAVLKNKLQNNTSQQVLLSSPTFVLALSGANCVKLNDSTFRQNDKACRVNK